MTYHARMRRQKAKTIFALLASLTLGLICASASLGREWTVEGKKVTAKAVDFNGRFVLLEDKKGKRKTVAINDLNAHDLDYLGKLLAIHNGEIQKEMSRTQLNQQQLALTAQIMDLWTVSMVAPNGQAGWQNYFAANSLEAKRMALMDYPTARITSVRRIRRPGQMGGGGNVLVPGVQILPGNFLLPVNSIRR